MGVANDGYWGIPVNPGARYRVSLYGKAEGTVTIPLAVSIESPDGLHRYGRSEILLVPGPWKHYDSILTTNVEQPPKRPDSSYI